MHAGILSCQFLVLGSQLHRDFSQHIYCNFIDQVGGAAVDAVRSGTGQFFRYVAAG